MHQNVHLRELLAEEPQSVLLGNGFSRYLSGALGQAEWSSYSRLLESAKPWMSTPARRAFEACQTDNFESVLEFVLRLHSFLSGEEPYDGRFDQLHSEVAHALTRAITEGHPDCPARQDLSRPGICAAVNFLSEFQTICSINFDLFIYWIAQQYRKKLQLSDGFVGRGPLVFRNRFPETHRHILYLHGALHFVNHGGEIRKRQWERHGSLLRQIRSAEHIPLCVIGGNSREKRAQIHQNVYLDTVWRRFRELKGTIVIFGCALEDSDLHLVDEILRNEKISQVALSRFQGDAGALQRFRHRAKEVGRKDLEVLSFDAEEIREF